MRSSTKAAAVVLALAVVGPAAGLEAPASAASPAAARDAKERSRAAFRAGVEALRAENWKDARVSFEKAWAFYPHPSILLNLGIARLKTGDPVLAEQDLVRFLSEDFGASPEELAGAREALAEAKKQLGTIRIVASPSTAKIVVDGSSIAERTAVGEGASRRDSVVAEVRAKAGEHTVDVEAAGYVAARRAVRLRGQSEAKVEIALAPDASSAATPPAGADAPRERSEARMVTGYALAGLSGIALVAAGVSAVRAVSLSNDYSDEGNPDQFQNPEVRSEGIAFRTAADLALGVAIVSGAAAVILLFTDLGASKSAAVKRRPPALLRW